MLIVVEAEMLKSISKAEVLIRYSYKVSMDIKNGDNGGSEKNSLPNGKGLSKIKLFNRMVKRKASYGIVPYVDLKESICFYYQLKGHWKRNNPNT